MIFLYIWIGLVVVAGIWVAWDMWSNRHKNTADPDDEDFYR